MGKMIDLLNQQFGYLTVIENMGKMDGRRYYWKCRCDCGKEVVIEGSRLRNGNTKSCGCHKFDGLKQYNIQQSEKSKIDIGTRFGKLVVIEDIGFKPQYKGATKNRRWYKCKCDCGNIVECSGNALKDGHRSSCGCVMSKGEEAIQDLLIKHNILFKHDTTSDLCTLATGHRLRFDFIIYNIDGTINRCIEFDGKQHQEGMMGGVWSHEETYDVIHERDEIKNQFCIDNNICLIRIPYTKLNYITYEDLMTDKYQVKWKER